MNTAERCLHSLQQGELACYGKNGLMQIGLKVRRQFIAQRKLATLIFSIKVKPVLKRAKKERQETVHNEKLI